MVAPPPISWGEQKSSKTDLTEKTEKKLTEKIK